MPLALILSSSMALAQSPRIQQVTRADARFVNLEQESLKCSYPNLVNRFPIDELNSRELKKNFSISAEDQERCPTTLKDFATHYDLLSDKPLAESRRLAFPLYSEVVKAWAEVPVTRKHLDKFGIRTLFQTKATRSLEPQTHVDPQKIEDYIRSIVKKTSNSECTAASNEKIRSDFSSADPRDAYRILYWKRILHEHGYACAASFYYFLSNELNSKNKFIANDPQNVFESSTNGFDSIGSEDLRQLQSAIAKSLSKNHVIIFFPPLGYDIPSELPREQLTMMEWKKSKFYSPSLKQRFETGYQVPKQKFVPGMGVPFEMIERVSVEDIYGQQIPDSNKQFLEAIEKHLRRNPNAKFVVMARSMGGFIAREVLEKNIQTRVQGKRVPDLIDVAILMGSTPYGSVIADYKGRVDQHHETYQTMTSFKTSLAHTALDIGSVFTRKESHFERLIEAGRVQSNVASMSHRHFNAERIVKSSLQPYRVLNIIHLKPSLDNYFEKAEKSKNTDFVFMHWAMFGPSEGSAPLSHASWDTNNSVRVFLKSYNHLAFWNLSPESGFALLLGGISTAEKLGMILKK
jgi:hypothetical protein